MKSGDSDGMLWPESSTERCEPGPHDVARAFDPVRLTQARHLAGLTKKQVADRVHVTPSAIGQFETGMARPRADLVPRLAKALSVPAAFFLAGRPHAQVDGAMAHFRSLRSTRVYQRHKAISHVEQAWELTHALEKRVRFPPVDLPGFADGEAHPGAALPPEPAAAARLLRDYWNLGTGPVSHLVRQLEARGIIVTSPPPDPDSATVDAFSAACLPRPIIVLTANRSDDVYRYRFTAAHELGHLVLHADTAPGDVQQEREADAFAAEFLTPRTSILPQLPGRTDLGRLAELQQVWGVSVSSLLYRCREVGLLSDSAASRAYQRLNALRSQPGFESEPVSRYPGEQPVLLKQAFELAGTQAGLTLPALAHELAWTTARLRELLGQPDQRPALQIVPLTESKACHPVGGRPCARAAIDPDLPVCVIMASLLQFFDSITARAIVADYVSRLARGRRRSSRSRTATTRSTGTRAESASCPIRSTGLRPTTEPALWARRLSLAAQHRCPAHRRLTVAATEGGPRAWG